MPTRQPWPQLSVRHVRMDSFPHIGTAKDWPSHFAGVLLGRLLLGSVWIPTHPPASNSKPARHSAN